MADHSPNRKLSRDHVVIDRLGFDDLPNVRYIHAACYRLIADRFNSEEDGAAVSRHILAPQYTDRLAEAVRNGTLIGARFEAELVGVAAWTPRSGGVRLDSLFVRPLMTGLGVGTMLLDAVEAAVAKAGFREVAVSGPIDTASFFEDRGYTTLSHGALTPTGTIQIPVAFMRKRLGGPSVSKPITEAEERTPAS